MKKLELNIEQIWDLEKLNKTSIYLKTKQENLQSELNNLENAVEVLSIYAIQKLKEIITACGGDNSKHYSIRNNEIFELEDNEHPPA